MLDTFQDHSYWMKQAIQLARKAYDEEEIPVGAVIVRDNKIIGRGYNQRESLRDPTAHAEILAITAAAATVEDWRLNGCRIYVTKEPCPMCAGAILNARLDLAVFGCYDEEKGCCGSLYSLCNDPRFGNTVPVLGGIEEEECSGLIQDFFRNRRKV